MQERALFDGGVRAATSGRRAARGVVRDIFGEGMLRADVGHADIGGFTGFGESVVA